jgi:hypothetical protein
VILCYPAGARSKSFSLAQPREPHLRKQPIHEHPTIWHLIRLNVPLLLFSSLFFSVFFSPELHTVSLHRYYFNYPTCHCQLSSTTGLYKYPYSHHLLIFGASSTVQPATYSVPSTGLISASPFLFLVQLLTALPDPSGILSHQFFLPSQSKPNPHSYNG